MRNNSYVDDCLKSLPTEGEASQLASDLRALLLIGGFRLTKRVSNSRRVLETNPVYERAKDAKTLELSKDGLPVERALGIKWCVESDTSSFNVELMLKPPTRRGILSVVSSVYDPLGLAAPFVLTVKKLLQDLCRLNLGSDDPIYLGGQHSLGAKVSRSSQIVATFCQVLHQTERFCRHFV